MSAGPSQDTEGEECELNLAPIIDCFTVLITYLLVSASFLSLDILEVQVATASDAPAPKTQLPPQVSVSIELGLENNIDIRLSGATPWVYQLAADKTGKWDLQRLGRQMQSIRKRFPEVQELGVKAHEKVKYGAIVRVIEFLKTQNLKVFLGE